MDLASTIEIIAAKGAMFWAATGSVALGGTLILVALVAQLRHLRRRTARNPVSPMVQETTAAEEPAPQASAPSVEVRAKDVPLPVENPNAAADLAELRALAARLRSAADRLEEFRRSREQVSGQGDESPLKETASGVDYVFRAGLG